MNFNFSKSSFCFLWLQIIYSRNTAKYIQHVHKKLKPLHNRVHRVKPVYAANLLRLHPNSVT